MPMPRVLRAALPAVLLVGLGMLLASGGKVALDHTNTTAFCISCHEMKSNNFAEYATTIHAKNRTGVKAACGDCHVPHEFPDVLWRKLGAANDVLHHLKGTIDSPEKFEAHRAALATRVWQRMKDTDSRECRHCHDTQAMDPERQGPTARKQHTRMQAENKTCIDCHYGIAHKEPEGADPASITSMAGSPLPTASR